MTINSLEVFENNMDFEFPAIPPSQKGVSCVRTHKNRDFFHHTKHKNYIFNESFIRQ